MTASPTSTDEGPACAAMGGGDLFRHKADERKFFAGDKSLTVEEVLELRWLEMEAANQREKAELRERLGLLPEDIDPNLGFSDPPLTAEEIRAQAEDRRRYLEEIAPTVDHQPTVILFDKNGDERLITEPLLEAERWQCTAYDENKRIGWQEWQENYDEAVARAAAASMAAFQARVAENEQEKTKHKKPKLDKDGRPVPMPDFVVAKLQVPKKRRQRVKERLRQFEQSTAHISSDRRRLPFTESFVSTALRSRLGIRGLALFNSRVPRDARVGSDKRAVFVGSEYMEQIFVRDVDYITIDWYKVRGQLVVDLDDNFPSLKALRRELMRLLGPTLMPTLIVYAKTAAGEIERPHLIWILPPGSEVGICGKSKGAPIRAFNLVQKAIVSALVELGADPGHENVAKFKNPLSPMWHVACEENFADLTDFLNHLPTLSVDKREMKRRQAKRQNVPVEEVTESQRNFRVSKDIILGVRARARRSNNRAYKDSLASPTKHAKWLKDNAVPRIIQALCYTPKTALKDCKEEDCPQEIRQLLAQQIAYWSGKRPSAKTKTYEGDNRYRDRDLQKDLGLTGAVNYAARKRNGIARKSLAAIETNRGHREKSLAIMYEQIGLFQRARGDVDDKPAVIAWIRKSGKLSKSTVYDLIDVAVSLFRAASRYIAKPSSPAKPRPLRSASTTPVTVPSVPVASINPVVTVPSDPATPASPVDHPTLVGQQPAAPSSSEQAFRLRPAEHSLASGLDPRFSDAAQPRSSDWLPFGGQRVDVR